MKRLLTCLATLLVALSAFAQQQLTGNVKDEFGEPMMAVSVFVQGSDNLVTTDLDGNYSITVKNGDVIEYSFLGKKSHVVTYKGGKA